MIEVYADGSCHPNPGGPGGWAFVAYQPDANGRRGRSWEMQCDSGMLLPGATSNNIAELMAATQALLWLDDKPGRVHCDSQYVVKGVNEWSHGWIKRNWQRLDKSTGELHPVANAVLWQLLLQAKRPWHQLCWVRGHNKDAGNERADQLAGGAREAAMAHS